MCGLLLTDVLNGRRFEPVKMEKYFGVFPGILSEIEAGIEFRISFMSNGIAGVLSIGDQSPAGLQVDCIGCLVYK